MNDSVFKEVEHTRFLVFDQIQYALVVFVRNLFHVDLLVDVAPFLLLENTQVEVLLQLFVAVVDAKLLEAVVVKDFETEYVQHADRDGHQGGMRRRLHTHATIPSCT